MPTPSSDLQNLNQTSGFIELFILDCSTLGGAVYHFTNHVSSTGGSLSFGSTTYTAIAIKAEGWDLVATGSQAKPTLTISNVSKTLLSAVISLGDIVGATVTRYRTYEKYLDGGSSPDATKFLGPDFFYIEQKVAHNNTIISWQLTTPIDRLGLKLPRRQILKDKGFPGVGATRVR